jgi:hypothetical protein
MALKQPGNHHMSLHFLAALVSVGLLTIIYACIVSHSRG